MGIPLRTNGTGAQNAKCALREGPLYRPAAPLLIFFVRSLKMEEQTNGERIKDAGIMGTVNGITSQRVKARSASYDERNKGEGQLLDSRVIYGSLEVRALYAKGIYDASRVGRV